MLVSLLLLLMTIFAFSFVIRILERPNFYTDFDNFYNSVYYTTVTVTTIGYGDYVPKTSLGRFASLILMVLGIVNVNLVNYSMIAFLELDVHEK